jgi:hypothetical protein
MEMARDLLLVAAIFQIQAQWSYVRMAITIPVVVVSYFPAVVILACNELAVDIRFFLNHRIAFIRQFYITTSDVYIELKRKIEAEEEPFISPYSERDEPAFLEAWIEAEESLQILGCSCISMLAATLHLYFKTWERQMGIPVDESLKSEFKKGWFNGYKCYFAQYASLRFEDGPVNLAVLEELVLARNRIQHPESITSYSSHYSDDDLQKLPHPFFLDEREQLFLAEIGEDEGIWLLQPTIHVSSEKLLKALAEVARFTEWMEQVEVS